MTTPTLEERIREILDKYTDNPMPEDKYYNKGQLAIVTEVMEAIQATGYRQTNHFEQVNIAADDKGVLYPAMKRGEWKKVAQDNGYLTEAEWRAKAEQEHKVSLHVKIRLWTPKGYDDLDNTWNPQVIKPRNKLRISLDARGKSFVEVEFTNDGEDLMTGQEWLSRFEKELDGDLLGHDFERATEAARKASGVDTPKP